MADETSKNRMDHVADVFVEEFRDWARLLGTREARLHLFGYSGSTIVCVYEPWPVGAPGLLVGDIIDDDWAGGEAVAELFVYPVVEMLEPGGSRGFRSPARADTSVIHWGPEVPFGGAVPRTPEQLRAGVAPPGFVSRLPVPWPGPAPPPPRQPRPPLKKMIADLAEFAVVWALFRVERRKD